jgi:hypothetical protein
VRVNARREEAVDFVDDPRRVVRPGDAPDRRTTVNVEPFHQRSRRTHVHQGVDKLGDAEAQSRAAELRVRD